MYFGNDKPNDKPVNIWVKPVRKDGKHLVTFCYHTRKIRQIMRPGEIDKYRNDPSYNVQASRS